MNPPLPLSSPVIRYMAMGVDALLIWVCAVVAYERHLCCQPLPGVALPDTALPGAVLGFLPPFYANMVLLGMLVMMVVSGRAYHAWRIHGLGYMLKSIAVSWLVTVLALVIWLFLSESLSDVSRVWFVSWTLGVLVLLCIERLVIYRALYWLRRAGYNCKTVLLVGTSDDCHAVQQTLAHDDWSGLRVQAAVSPDKIAVALQTAHDIPPHEIWLCMPLSDKAGMAAVLHTLRHCAANIRLVPDSFTAGLMQHGVSQIAGIDMLNVSTSPLTGDVRLVKAVEDFLGALVILGVIGIPMLVIALAVKLSSPGPVLFVQMRHGWNGQPIWVYKFRSMVVHTEDDFQVTQACRSDPRITPLGAFLRRTSLDELPQFINVLQGRMSIVGPRPHAVEHNVYYKELVHGYMLRHRVKPGITGWAQINGCRGETDTLDKMKKRVEYDLFYIYDWSLWLDIKIIVITTFKGWVHKNAY